MDWTNLRFLPVFHIVLWLQAALADVKPPTNVTLHCHNLHNVLKWNYDQSFPGLKFRVTISSPDVLWVDPPAQQVDLSFLSDANNEYFLQVTAVIGENKSESVPHEGIIFSYFKDSPGPTTQKCSVDLPPVNVTAQPDAKVLFRFTHPWLLYSKKLTSGSNPKRRMKKSSDHASEVEELLPEFEYSVTMDKRHHGFICEESVCEETLPVDAKQENHCLTVTGVLAKMTVKATQVYCAAPFAEKSISNNTIYIVVGLLAVGVAVIFVLGMVYRKITNPSLPFPLVFKSLGHNVCQTIRPTLAPVTEVITVPGVEPTTPTPLLSEEKEMTEEDEYSSTVIPDTFVHLPIQNITEDQGMCDDIEGGQPDNEESGYMGGMPMEEDETQSSNEASSGYERRPVIDNLAPDDRAEGYRG